MSDIIRKELQIEFQAVVIYGVKMLKSGIKLYPKETSELMIHAEKRKLEGPIGKMSKEDFSSENRPLGLIPEDDGGN